MNCAFLIELNERLKTDVTVNHMRLNKGLEIEYTGSIAKVGRQEEGCPMGCGLKTRDGHYQMALRAMYSSLYLNQ